MKQIIVGVLLLLAFRLNSARADDPVHALVYAASRGQVATVKTLLDSGVDVNGRVENGITALMAAAYARYAGDTVALLLDRHADVNAQDEWGSTALITMFDPWVSNYCPYYSDHFDVPVDTRVLAALLAHGANPNLVDGRGVGPLHGAIETDMSPFIQPYGESVKMLLAAGETVRIDEIESAFEHGLNTDDDGRGEAAVNQDAFRLLGAIYRADGTWSIDPAKLVQTKAAILQMDGGKFKWHGALIQAERGTSRTSAAADRAIIKATLALGANVNYVEKGGDSPLTSAIAMTDSSIVELLLQAGANPDVSGPFGFTPLMEAIIHTNLDSLLVVLKYGANVNLRNQYGKTALGMAEDDGRSMPAIIAAIKAAGGIR